jgi:hypothetical protein
VSIFIKPTYIAGSFCVQCGNDTSFGSGRFVNRIPAVVDVAGTFFEESVGGSFTEVEGWLCPECQEEPDVHSAEFGHQWLVKVEYNTEADGSQVLCNTTIWPETLHGPFDTIEEAAAWMDSYPDDPDVVEVSVIVMNRVRP